MELIGNHCEGGFILPTSIVKGGKAGLNSVMYYSNTHMVKAIWNNKQGEIEIIVKPLIDSKIEKIGLLLRGIPFIRGLWLLIEVFFSSWKLFLLSFSLLILNYLLLMFIKDEKNGEFINQFILNMISDNKFYLSIIALTLFILSLVIKRTELGKYHGAEHMVDNAYEDSENLSISNVIKFSRIHSRCGTNLVVFILVFNIILFYLINDIRINVAISFILGYEVYMIENPIINFFLKPLYFLGYACQKYLFTSVPERKHLRVAIAAYETLLRESRLR